MASKLVQRFLRDQRGLAAVEYVVLTTGIAIVIVGAVAASGAGVSNKLNAVSSGMSSETVADTGDQPVDAEPIAMPIMRPIARPIAIATPIAADF